MKLIATICSRRKRDDFGLLAAYERYIGDHVSQVMKMAEVEKLPFYILSGKYGLINSDQPIPYYDYYLEKESVDSLSKLVADQIMTANITEIDFYSEDKDSWIPYVDTLQKAVKLAGTKLNTQML